MRDENVYPGGMHSFTLLFSCIFYYEGNIVRNLRGRYDEITRKSTAECTITEGDFLMMTGRCSRHSRQVHLSEALFRFKTIKFIG